MRKEIDCRLCGSLCLSSLACLPENVLKEFNINKTARKYEPGQIIFYEDNKPYGVYCVESGKVKLTKYTPDGKTYIARIATGGDLLGYRAFLTNESYSATAEVLEPATICFIEREPFMRALKDNPQFALQLMEQLGSDLKQAENRARDLAYKSVAERLAEMLLTFKESYGEEDKDGHVHLAIRLSREEMASILGTTIETTVRNLTKFKHQGLIELDKKEIILLDTRGIAEYIPGF